MLFILFIRRHVIFVSTWSRVYNSLLSVSRTAHKHTDTCAQLQTHSHKQNHTHFHKDIHKHTHTNSHIQDEIFYIEMLFLGLLAQNVIAPDRQTHTHTHTHSLSVSLSASLSLSHTHTHTH